MSIIGYARVSTADQDTALQTDALSAAGCDRIFVDHASGVDAGRPELRSCLDFLRAGDTLIVWKLDRLGRSLGHLIAVVEDLARRRIGFRCTTQTFIDTTTPAGRMVFQIFGAVGEFERELIRERVNAGLEAARARGRVGGRRFRCAPERQVEIVAYAEKHGPSAAAAQWDISRQTVARYVSAATAI